MLAASALAQTATKPPHKPAPAIKTAAATARPAARPAGAHPTIIPRRPVFVPPPPVIELDEIAVIPDLPTVLDNDARDSYRRIFQAQAAGQFAQADADIARLSDKDFAERASSNRDVILLAAHYDSVPAGPGASDDGAAVASVLEIARILAARPAPQRLKNAAMNKSLGTRGHLLTGTPIFPSPVMLCALSSKPYFDPCPSRCLAASAIARGSPDRWRRNPGRQVCFPASGAARPLRLRPASFSGLAKRGQRLAHM